MSSSFVRFEKEWKLCSDGGGWGSKNCKYIYNGASGWVWRSLVLAGVWNLKSGDRFCVDTFGSNLLQSP
jgi:hypothetical protein